MTQVIVAGHICLDIIPQFEQAGSIPDLIVPGRLTEIGPVALATGGAVSNAGLNLHRLGIAASLMGKVGDDLFGQAILNIIRSYDEALADGMIVTPGAVSSYTLVIEPPGTDRAFLHCAGANRTFGAEDVPYAQLETARLFHFGYPPIMERTFANDGEALVAMFRRAKATGVTTTLDMTMPDPKGVSGQVDWRAILERTLPYVDMFVPSFDELLYMLARPRFEALDAQGPLRAHTVPADVQALADDVMAMGARTLLLKLGEDGAYLRTANALDADAMGRGAPADADAWSARELWAPCLVPTQIAGTTGSGDATIAGFFAALLRDHGPEGALTLATAVGAHSVEGTTSLNGVRSWKATIARLEAGWARDTLELDAPGWHWDDARQLWLGPRDLA